MAPFAVSPLTDKYSTVTLLPATGDVPRTVLLPKVTSYSPFGVSFNMQTVELDVNDVAFLKSVNVVNEEPDGVSKLRTIAVSISIVVSGIIYAAFSVCAVMLNVFVVVVPSKTFIFATLSAVVNA